MYDYIVAKEFGYVHLSVLPNVLTLSQTSPDFYMSAVQAFWKHWR